MKIQCCGKDKITKVGGHETKNSLKVRNAKEGDQTTFIFTLEEEENEEASFFK